MSAGSVMAAGSVRDNCGCGLGTMVLKDSEPTVLIQVVATFLNGICANQTFGITSGTLECTPAQSIASNQRIRTYVTANMDQLAVDIAVGQGSTLNALADLMEVPQSDRGALFTKMQSNFDRIFTTADLSADTLVLNLDAVLRG